MSAPPASGVVLVTVPCRQDHADALERSLPFGCLLIPRLPHVGLNPARADQPVPALVSEAAHE